MIIFNTECVWLMHFIHCLQGCMLLWKGVSNTMEVHSRDSKGVGMTNHPKTSLILPRQWWGSIGKIKIKPKQTSDWPRIVPKGYHGILKMFLELSDWLTELTWLTNWLTDWLTNWLMLMPQAWFFHCSRSLQSVYVDFPGKASKLVLIFIAYELDTPRRNLLDSIISVKRSR